MWRCHLQLLSYNNSVRVAYHNLNGASEGVKVSLTCNWCCIYYGYSKYGNPSSGWNLYDAIRITVEATVLCVCSGWHFYDEPTVAYLTYKLSLQRRLLPPFVLIIVISGCHPVVFLRPSTKFTAWKPVSISFLSENLTATTILFLKIVSQYIMCLVTQRNSCWPLFSCTSWRKTQVN